MAEKVPDEIAAIVLGKSGRHCSLCRRFDPTMIQVHHIKEQANGGTDDFDNLIAICVTCHSDVHTHRPFTRRFSEQELRIHRDRVYEMVAEGKLVAPQRNPSTIETAVIQHAGSPGISSNSEIRDVSFSEDAARVLIAAAEHDGYIIATESSAGFDVQAGGKAFITDRSAREQARWRKIVEELFDYGLCKGDGTVGLLTHDGYMAADKFRAIMAQNAVASTG